MPLTQILHHLSLAERLSVASLVCRSWRAACREPELLCQVAFDASRGRPQSAERRLHYSFLPWLAHNGGHVRSLAIELPPADHLLRRLPAAQRLASAKEAAQLRCVLLECLEALGSQQPQGQGQQQGQGAHAGEPVAAAALTMATCGSGQALPAAVNSGLQEFRLAWVAESSISIPGRMFTAFPCLRCLSVRGVGLDSLECLTRLPGLSRLEVPSESSPYATAQLPAGLTRLAIGSRLPQLLLPQVRSCACLNADTAVAA